MSKKPHLRRYSEVRPTEAAADGCDHVMRVDIFGVEFAHWKCTHLDSCWCRVDEWQDHLQSLINGDTGDEEESGWVYAKDRWPTEKDGPSILWMADTWVRPVVAWANSYGVTSMSFRNNLRWCRIPPDPPKKPRELPVVAPTEFPAFVTLRDGSHAIVHGRHPDEQSTTLLGGIVNELRTLALDCPHWYASTGKAHSDPKKLNKHDIVHVGGWLSAAELEAKRNET